MTALGRMYGRCKDELICDFAEYYHIYDLNAFPIRYIALLAAGLRDESRTKIKMNDMKLGMQSLMLAKIADNTSFLVWAKTEDGMNNVNRPPMILEALMKEDDPEAVQGFDTVEDFRNEYERRVRNKNGSNFDR